MDSFTEGMICRVCCENFRTYPNIKFRPTPKLNMIVGPNGSGKSSMVYAIVLGLGGKPSVIGKEKNLSAYVKRGCKYAKTEIELYSTPSNVVVERTITVDNKSSWKLNGQPSSLKAVEDIITKLNIQVDNLCQFLPQDKVQDFAKMDSKQLLENTLKTVGSSDVVELLGCLKDLRQQEVNLNSVTQTKKSLLESEKKKIASLETEVRAIKEREDVLNKIKIMEKKKAWVEFEEVDEEKKQLMKEKDKHIKLKKAAENEMAPYRKAVEDIRVAIRNKEKSINNEMAVGKDLTSTLRSSFDETTSTDDKIHNVKRELERTIDAERRKKQAVLSMEEELQRLEKVIDTQREEQLSSQIPNVMQNLARQNIMARNIQSRKLELEEMVADVVRQQRLLESALARERSAADRKKQMLSQRFKDAYQAYEWLQTNQDQFQSKIYGPLMLEINCSEIIAKYVEFSISHQDLVAFVCENKNDMNKLLRMLRDEKRWRINAVMAPANNGQPARQKYRPPYQIDQISCYGFWTYLLDQVEGPETVLHYLCHNYKLHRIPVGNDQTGRLIDQIPTGTFSFFFSDTQNFTVKMSKYSGEKSSRVVNVNQSVLLAGSLNSKLIAEHTNSLNQEQKKLNKIKESLEDVKSQQSQCDLQLNEFRDLKHSLEQELQNLKKARTKLMMKKSDLENLINQNSIDIDSEKEKAKLKINRLVVDMCRKQARVSATLQKYQASLKKIGMENFKQSKLQDYLNVKQIESEAASKKLEDCKKLLSNIEENVKAAERNSKKAYDAALKCTENLNPKDLRFKRKYEKAFAELAGDVEGLEQAISALTSRADCLAGGRALILEEYEKTQRAIRNLEAEVANPTLRLQHLKEEMLVKKKKWLPQVETLVGKINKNFSKFFSQMSCAGEVILEKPENEDEYKEYGISLMVQFRANDRMQKLSPHTQSGGERAVSTAIYMLALQELTTVPFRCVDEINQGMDEHNERIVFQLLVNTVENANSAQCFLLTPKILHNLNYSANVTVQCIYTGVSSNSVTVEKYLDGLRKSKKRASLKRKHSDSEDQSD